MTFFAHWSVRVLDAGCLDLLQVFEEGFAQVFTDVLWYQAMGVAQVVLCVIKMKRMSGIN